MNVIVLGAGLVGAPMAVELNGDERFEVAVADLSEEALANTKARCPELSVLRKDLSNPEDVTTLVSGYDLVINAVPGVLCKKPLPYICARIWTLLAKSDAHCQRASREWKIHLSGAASGHAIDFANKVESGRYPQERNFAAYRSHRKKRVNGNEVSL